MAITVGVISDASCPWCWVGKRRPEKAVAAVAGTHGGGVRHSFESHPDVPCGGDGRSGRRAP